MDERKRGRPPSPDFNPNTRKSVFRVPVTVYLEVEVLETHDVDVDRAIAYTFAADYARGLKYKSQESQVYGDPVQVRDVTIGDYPVHIKSYTKEEIP